MADYYNIKNIKCVIWDLDNTIWNGVLTEDSSVSLKDGITHIIKTLDSRGILNSVCSRNEYEDAAKKLKDFGILDYFLYPQINWGNKSESVKRIAELLNISIDSILFIDDQPYELDEVKSIHPGINCINASDYKLLPEMPCLNPGFITEDSARRRQMYIDDDNRKKDEESYSGPKGKFLQSLNMKLIVKKAEEKDLRRLEELTIRTHQLNTTGKTYSYNELLNLMRTDRYILLTAELDDIYGSYGKIGLVLLEKTGREIKIKLFILSCRVMNRGIGTIILNEIVKAAKDAALNLSAEFVHTDRNKIMYVTLKFANFIEADTFGTEDVVILHNDLSVVNNNPPHINIITEKEWI